MGGLALLTAALFATGQLPENVDVFLAPNRARLRVARLAIIDKIDRGESFSTQEIKSFEALVVGAEGVWRGCVIITAGKTSNELPAATRRGRALAACQADRQEMGNWHRVFGRASRSAGAPFDDPKSLRAAEARGLAMLDKFLSENR